MRQVFLKILLSYLLLFEILTYCSRLLLRFCSIRNSYWIIFTFSINLIVKYHIKQDRMTKISTRTPFPHGTEACLTTGPVGACPSHPMEATVTIFLPTSVSTTWESGLPI